MSEAPDFHTLADTAFAGDFQGGTDVVAREGSYSASLSLDIPQGPHGCRVICLEERHRPMPPEVEYVEVAWPDGSESVEEVELEPWPCMRAIGLPADGSAPRYASTDRGEDPNELIFNANYGRMAGTLDLAIIAPYLGIYLDRQSARRAD